MEIITHYLRVQSGGNLSIMILLLIKYKYPLPDYQKWQEYVGHDGPAHEMRIRTR